MSYTMLYKEYELKYNDLLSQARAKEQEAEAVARECQTIYNTSPYKFNEIEQQTLQIPKELRALISDYYDTIGKHEAIIPQNYFRTNHTNQLHRVPKELRQTLSRHTRTGSQGYRVSIASLQVT